MGLGGISCHSMGGVIGHLSIVGCRVVSQERTVCKIEIVGSVSLHLRLCSVLHRRSGRIFRGTEVLSR
jgi:hypothetical protein